MQEYLAAAEPQTPTTGIFDAATQTALQTFQLARGLLLTGVADASTWPALLTLTPIPSSGPPLRCPGGPPADGSERRHGDERADGGERRTGASTSATTTTAATGASGATGARARPRPPAARPCPSGAGPQRRAARLGIASTGLRGPMSSAKRTAAAAAWRSSRPACGSRRRG